MKLIYADTETTGLDAKLNEVVQFAFIIEINKKVVAEENFKLRPERPDHISDEALKVTGKTRSDLMAYPERGIQFQRIQEALGLHVKKYDRTGKRLWDRKDFAKEWNAGDSTGAVAVRLGLSLGTVRARVQLMRAEGVVMKKHQRRSGGKTKARLLNALLGSAILHIIKAADFLERYARMAEAR